VTHSKLLTHLGGNPKSIFYIIGHDLNRKKFFQLLNKKVLPFLQKIEMDLPPLCVSN